MGRVRIVRFLDGVWKESRFCVPASGTCPPILLFVRVSPHGRHFTADGFSLSPRASVDHR